MGTTFESAQLPTLDEAQVAKETLRKLSSHVHESVLLRTTDSDEAIELPRPAVELLMKILTTMADGDAATIIPVHAELTTQQAADMLGVSRPFIVKQIEHGVIPHRKIGRHRRLLIRDLVAYKERMDQGREDALDALTAEAQDLGMGY